MATLSITIPDDIAVRVRDGFCYAHHYQDEVGTVDGGFIPNPETKTVFMKRKVKEFIKESVKAYEATKSAEVARLTASASVENDVQLD